MPSFFVPTPGDLTAQESPPPGIGHLRPKTCYCPGVSPEGGGVLGAAGIDWCIIKIIQFSLNMGKMFFDIIVITQL